MHAPNVPEVECRVSNVIALFRLNVGWPFAHHGFVSGFDAGVNQRF
jgi:hypothetical protein